MARMTSRPVASTIVRTTLTRTDSEMPMRLTAEIASRKNHAAASVGTVTNSAR